MLIKERGMGEWVCLKNCGFVYLNKGRIYD